MAAITDLSNSGNYRIRMHKAKSQKAKI